MDRIATTTGTTVLNAGWWSR